MAIKRLDHVNFITHDMAATIFFYEKIIGLLHGEQVSIDTARSVYFYIPNQKVAILHIGNAPSDKHQPKFDRLASLSKDNQGRFSTGAFDHVCLALDERDYPVFINKLNHEGLEYQTFAHTDVSLKQIWLLDPNGIRVELNFTSD